MEPVLSLSKHSNPTEGTSLRSQRAMAGKPFDSTLMTTDDSKRWHKEKTSPSSPDYFQVDKKMEREKLAKEAQKNQKRELLRLQVELTKGKQEEEAKSRPAKERKQEVAEAKEKHEDAGSFTEKMRKREEEREQAKAQSSPEEQAAGPL